ncbi:restriction endonuclease [Metabacillus fastidiosus]|uniref:restriction endonuclease n=1 Tax=Metabacillus fastidiosus TaxID=1458 RepID=UPI003D2E0DEC
MSRLSNKRIKAFFKAGDLAATTTEKGTALEDLTCYIFEKVSGITVTARNELNIFDTEEIDVAFWNDKLHDGLHFLPHIILVECKNWSNAVGSSEVSWFDKKLENHGQNFGILIAANGITGNSVDKNRAHQIIRDALKQKREIIVITRQEIERLTSTNQIVHMIKEKKCLLAVSGSSLK